MKDNKMHYAIRRQRKPVLIDRFPIANLRIQKAMAGLREVLNEGDTPLLRQNLTSISFSSSWRDLVDDDDDDDRYVFEGSDCLVTLHYNAAIQDQSKWEMEAKHVCTDLSLTQITGRSRKRFARAFNTGDEPIIRDTIWLTTCGFDLKEWKVSCKNQGHNATTRTVRYEKPEGAFCHPNATTMCHALEWLLNRISSISVDRKVRLLEMYCGCGAHTVALLQTGLLEKIVAVEMDARLVKACRRNYALNKSGSGMITQVEIVSSDASIWARDSLHDAVSFDILLVDPPRQGLTKDICRMAIDGSIQHFLYISCGRAVLLRDLELLHNYFEVVDCTLLDLFPQTNAVETLVHLQRRKS
jgi:23S rRNA (uracil1939-C5)-methyltransferase